MPVLTYHTDGLGPLIFSPLSEVPAYGRTIFCALLLFLYSSTDALADVLPMGLVTLLSIGIPLVNNFAGLLVLRFLTGFLASPALATGGSSLVDVIAPHNVPYAFIGWSLGCDHSSLIPASC